VKAWADGERLGTWARSLFRAPMTRPGDPEERAAEQAAHAAPTTSRAPAPDTGTPPWGGGRALSAAERTVHEPRLGTELPDVRVHEGAAPARWAKALRSRAFSVGRDVVLGEGAHDANVMAHELSHVVAARGTTQPVIARVALTAADFEALADSLHDAITTATADEELIYVALQKLERDATAATTLRTTYRTRHTTDLVTALRGRLTGSRLNLALTLLSVALPAGTASPVAATPPSTPAQYEAVARAVNTALVATPADCEAVYSALLPLGRDAARVTTLKSTYLTLFPTTTSLDAHIASVLTGADAAYALYLLNAPGPATPHSPTNIPARPGAGTPPATAPPAVTGGTVSIGTQTPYTTTSGSSATFSFGVGYSGGLSADTRMLQFIWREIIVTNAAGATAPLAGTVTTTGVPYALTTTPATPTRRVDSNSTTTPFYDESHSTSTFRDATSVATYDAPSPIRSMVSAQFAAGATRVVSREHFDIFLVRDFSTIYHVVIDIEHVATSPTASSTSRRVVSATAATSLPADMRTALLARYPSFAYIR
jgi:hypothetical protein